MLWIHGGAFQAGTGAAPWYSGSKLATTGDVVVVTINYRLGPFGFAHLAGVLDDERFAGSGNNGIRDQIAALQWVREHIAAFGGDPANVTIFGESAGGMSVGVLLGTPAAAGLFHRAIPQSGAASHAMAAATAESMTGRLLEHLELSAKDADRLLALPVEDIMAVQGQLMMGADAGGEIVMPFMPVVDGVVLPQPPLEAIRAGLSGGVPVTLGTTAEEFNLFGLLDRSRGGIDDQRLERRAQRLFGDRSTEAIDIYRREKPDADPQDRWCAIATDWMFRIPAVRLAEAQRDAGGEVWSYLFSYRSRLPGSLLGACHAIEIPFVFNNLHRRGVDMLLGPIGDDTLALGEAMSGAWLQFARDGEPAHHALPDWPAYEQSDRSVLDLDVTSRVVHDPGQEAREFWASLAS
jgi:para-nitrobenzyl esterase